VKGLILQERRLRIEPLPAVEELVRRKRDLLPSRADGTAVNSFGFFPSADAQLSERTISCGEENACVSPHEYAYYIELVLWKPEIANDPKVVALRAWVY
jgi:hypothetical protein